MKFDDNFLEKKKLSSKKLREHVKRKDIKNYDSVFREFIYKNRQKRVGFEYG